MTTPVVHVNRYVSDCDHGWFDGKLCWDEGCVWPCDRCADADTADHVHCDGCDAIKCHGWWWRHKGNRSYRTDPDDPRGGLDKVRDAVRAARGGDAPPQIRGYA